jgi:REP-associated tyrosine transposase
MPRLARLDAPGVLHHVMGRGIEGNDIFQSDTDRQDFVDRLKKLAVKGAFDVYAWTLMPNHFHLLVKTRNQPLSANMRKLLTGCHLTANRK